MHDFDADGMVPKIDVGRKIGSTCLVGMQVQNGKFVRIDPVDTRDLRLRRRTSRR